MDKPVLSSHSTIPAKTELIAQSSVPLTISFTLDTLSEVPEAASITRCDTCKCYINPFVEVVQPGFEWRCNLCYTLNKVPAPFNRLRDITTQSDRFSPSLNAVNNESYESIELSSAVYEVQASPSYVLKSPTQPVLCFIIEFTETSMKNFSVTTILNEIKENINGKDLKFCILFTNEFCYLLNRNGSLTVVPDLKNLPSIFTDDFMLSKVDLVCVDSVAPGQRFDMHGALHLSTSILKTTGGTVFTFCSSMPLFIGDIGNAYIDMSRKMSHYAICMNLFLFPTVNVSLKDFYVIPKATGGGVYYYPNFNGGDIYFVNRFIKDFSMLFINGFYNDAICKIRGSEGVKILEYCGNFTRKSNDVLAFANFNPTHSVTFKYKVNSLKADVCFQAAILRTVGNRRMIRVTNFTIPFDNANDLYTGINPYAVITHLSALTMTNLEKGREKINNFIASTISSHRKTNPSILPLNLQILPLLCLSLSKSLPLRPSSQTPMDYRMYYVYLFTNMHPSFVDFLIHPVLLPLHSLVGGEEVDPLMCLNYALSLSVESIERNGLYLLDTGINIFIFDTDCDLAEFIVGSVDTGRILMERHDNVYSERVHGILNVLAKPISQNFLYVKEAKQSVFKDIFMSYLVCDRNNGMESYGEYIQKLSK